MIARKKLSALSVAVFAFGILHSAFCIATPASAYVQDGLVACWDGVENAGTGVHDANAAVWKDLVAGREFSLYDVTVGENRMTFAGAKTSYGSLNAADTEAVFLPATNGTVEVVYASLISGNAVQTIIQSSTASGITMTFANQNLFYAGNATLPRYTISYGLATNTTAVHYSNAKPAAAFQNCVALATTSAVNVGGSKATTTIGHTSSDNYNFKGHIFCIRVYNRHLTADELASNRELDLDRFVNGAAGAADTITCSKVKIANFDEDLATVYVNGEPAPNGAVFTIAKGDTFTVDIRDFQNDWYFAYAPPSQTDRTLAFDYWGGLPAGSVSNTATCTFTPREYLTTVVPNIDCKGYVWTAYDTTTISNATFRMSANAFNPDTRSLRLGTCNAYYAGDKVMDLAMRVNYFGTNYTITAIGNSPVNGHGAVEMRVPKRLASIGMLTSSGTTMTNIVGISETALSTIPNMAFDQAPLHGPIMNYIPESVTSVGHYAYRRGGGQTQFMFNGPLVLPHVTSFGVDAFRGCAYVTELCATSPALTTLSSGAFQGCPRLMNVTLASPILASVDVKAFTAITNLAYLSAPPAQAVLDRLVATVAASDGGKALTMRVPIGTPGWWDFVSEPTAAEVSAGLPEGCYGTFVTGTGDRKGWMIATDDVDASLVVTDMSLICNEGYEIHAGLAQGDTLTLSREGFTICDLQHFNRATGAWETFETKRTASFTYVHDGQLTRARWKVDGFSLNLFSECYGGTFAISGAEPIVGDNIYAPNAVLTVTAVGRAEHPTSHFAEWTSGVAGSATNSASITLTMDSDKTLAAAFAPDEWYYDPSTHKITDGEWTSATAVTLDATAKTVKSGAFASPAGHYTLWLDLSLPVLVETDPTSAYHVTELTFADDGLIRKLRLGTRFKSFATSAFRYTTVLERLDGMGSSSMTAMPYYFFMLADSCPLHFQTYEANDFLPETLVTLYEAWYAGGPYLVGTLRLPNLTSYRTDGAFPNRTAGVTNLYLTCETLASFPYKLFHGMKLQELTIGSTNLATAVSDSFSGAAATLERMNFLAHAPAAAALNNILASYNSRTTTSAKPLEIHCSKRAPGWRALKAEVDKSSDEWLARPEGTWGIYQTAAGKRFYLVQRDSKYDEKLQTVIILQ